MQQNDSVVNNHLIQQSITVPFSGAFFTTQNGNGSDACPPTLAMKEEYQGSLACSGFLPNGSI